MRTDVIVIENNQEGREKALNAIEGMADVSGLSKKNSLYLRLLSEEALGLIYALAGQYKAYFWGEQDRDEYSILVEAVIKDGTAHKLEKVATVSEVEKENGIMGKIRLIYRNLLLTGSLIEGRGLRPDKIWSLKTYRDSIEKSDERADEARGELERSVVSRLADDVTVSVMGDKARMVIYKKFA
ncbi:MAG: hypothetical protein J6O55_06860 [Lachnospiraceae bacterium]|nr:hypothetical protein [Lachnospiraceae bacterium]